MSEFKSKSMRAVTLRRLQFRASANLGGADMALWNLKRSFEDGEIPACKARKEAAKLLFAYEIDLRRFNAICAAREDPVCSSEMFDFYREYFSI